MSKSTYWENKGRFQNLYDKVQKLIPKQGSVINSKQNKDLEKLRIASNCYYDFYNNGLCNRATEFYKVFKLAGTKLLDKPYPHKILEIKMDQIILNAAIEQKIIEV